MTTIKKPENLTVALSFMRPAVEYVREQGKDIRPLLDILGVTEADLSDPDIRVADSVSEPFMATAEALCEDPNIGLHAGSRMQASHLGILGLLVLTCESAKDAFDLVQRYQTLVGNGGAVRVVAEADELVLLYEAHPERPQPYPRHTVESCLIGWTNIARAIGGRRFQVNRITIACEPPLDISEQEKAFDCVVEYNAAVNSIRMPAEYASVELFAGDPHLKALLEAQASQRLLALQGAQTDADPVVAKAKQLVANALAYGVPHIDEVAEQFHTSARTLQRQLDAAGKGYKELVDEVRADLASKYMRDQQLSLLDVALMLGFSEQSSFQRAFKRWFHKTPGQYRAGLDSAEH